MNPFRRALPLVFALLACASLGAQTLDLSSGWRIHKGNSFDWAAPDFNDAHWQEVEVGRAWERSGLPGYDGYAWYRLRVEIPAALGAGDFAAHYKTLALQLGAIDDADRCYFNGVEIGRTESYDVMRNYEVPFDLVRWDAANVIAVRVYDDGGDGGLYTGTYSLEVPEWRQFVKFDLPLDGGDGIFPAGKPMNLDLEISNTAFTAMDGIVTWEVYGNTWRRLERGPAIRTQRSAIALLPGETKRAGFAYDPPGAGFYHVAYSFARNGEPRVITKTMQIAYAPEEALRPPTPPRDLRAFWDRALGELKGIDPQFKLTPAPEHSTEDADCYLLEFRSIGDVRIRGWYQVPKRTGPHPAMLRVPGYTGAMQPAQGVGDWAVLSLDIRGHGNSQDDVPGGRPDFLLRGLEAPDTYFYRGAYMDCVRAVDFLVGRPEIDPERIGVQGGSQGGMLSLVTAGLVPDIALCVPDVPFTFDSGRGFDITEWPGSVLRDWVAAEPGSRSIEAAYETLCYFDAKNFAPWIRCPVFMGVGLQDPVCPAPTNFAAYNNISTEKEYRVYPFSGHGLPNTHWRAQYDWIEEQFQKNQPH